MIFRRGFLIENFERALVRVLDEISFFKTQWLESFLKNFSSVDDRIATETDQDFTNAVDGSVSDMQSFAEAFLNERQKNFIDHEFRVEDAKNR